MASRSPDAAWIVAVGASSVDTVGGLRYAQTGVRGGFAGAVERTTGRAIAAADSVAPRESRGAVRSHTVYKTFRTEQRRAFVRITDDVQRAVGESGIHEGMVLVSAMHITAGVWVNDDEPGIHADALEWLDKLAPPTWQPPANDVARGLLPEGGDYRHHGGGEENGDAHLKNLLVHHQVIVPVTDGRLDLGPWQAVFYCEFDGLRSKRLIIKVLGE